MIQDDGKQHWFDQTAIIREEEEAWQSVVEADVLHWVRVTNAAHPELPPPDPSYRRAQQEALAKTRH